MRKSTLILLLGSMLMVMASGCGDIVTPTATPIPSSTPPAPIKIAIQSFHGRYVTARGENSDWVLGQTPELGDCEWFTQHRLDNGKIALVTCHDRYVTAPITGTVRSDWLLGQELELGDCGQFDLYELGDDRVAFKTCAGNFFTAGDEYWEPPLQWTVVAETDIFGGWEIFTILEQ